MSGIDKELADRLDGKPAQDASVSIEHRRAEELTTEELMAIAAGGLATAPPRHRRRALRLCHA
jgi:hypothetical protein